MLVIVALPNGYMVDGISAKTIHAEYEATTTTVNYSCLMYGYYFDAILLN